jgi:GTPase SAR1 family protein
MGPKAMQFPTVLDGLKSIYHNKIEPVEISSSFDQFFSSRLSDRDLDSKPMVLLLGQYSTGKTTFINYLLQNEYPGAHIGPEPTVNMYNKTKIFIISLQTDKFVAVMHGQSERILPGNAATVQAELPFCGLSNFGTSFLSKFNISFTDAPLTEFLTLIDTPGVLSGDKQRLGRSYDFVKAVEWFAQRSDMILLLFDAHKLDISDEFRNVIHALKGHDDKVRIVLNKADSISNQQLMRVYGALMWSLGKVINTPEVMRVYVGSFWNPESTGGKTFIPQNCELIQTEHADLLRDLRNLPRQAAMRKVNNLVKRARLARVHAYLIEYMRREIPTFFGKASKQKKLIDQLPEIFHKVQQMYNLAEGDFPDVSEFQESLKQIDISIFSKLNTKSMANLDDALAIDLPTLMQMFPQDFKVFADGMPKNPFSSDRLQMLNPDDPEIWLIKAEDRRRYHQIFQNISVSMNGKLSGIQAKNFLSDSKLSDNDLAHIWELSDSDHDGAFTEQEFAVAMHLVTLKLHGINIPDTLVIK